MKKSNPKSDSVPHTEPAPAKLTVSLRVTGTRDDGYHLIDAEMVSLSLGDLIIIDPDSSGVAATGPYAPGVPCDDSNLVAKALRLAGRTGHVTIDKQVPHGGGLGGGSSDAAAVLRWAGFPSDAAGLRAAASIGADVAFCLVGGRARVTGIGEIIEPLPFREQAFTLIIPPFHVSTPAVYRAWDDLNLNPSAADQHVGEPEIRKSTAAESTATESTANSTNDLEAAAIMVEPRLAWWRDRITELCGTAPTLAGSGATWFLHGAREDALDALRNEGAQVMVCKTVDAHR